MEFRQLKYLLVLAETRNMTRAAEQLYISQSALSHYLKCVEDELGVRLFDRSTNPMQLTYAGECYMESARKIMIESDQLRRELRDITQHMSGKIKLGTSRDRASYMMPRIMTAFLERYSGMEYEIFTASGQKLFDALRTGRVDLVLLPDAGQADSQGLCSEHIYSEELVLAAKKDMLPPEARIEGQQAVRSKALDGAPFFLLFQEHAMRYFCDRWFKREKIHPEIRMEFSSNISCFRMAAAGLGYAIIPYLTTKLANPGEDIELFSLGKRPETWDVHMFYRKGAYLGVPEQELIQIAKEQFAHESL